MTKLYFDKKKIDERILPNIQDGIIELKKAKNVANNISIPNEFYYTNGTKRCISNINSLCSNLIKVKDWLSSSNNELQKIVNELEDDIKDISSFNLEERKNIIL